MKIKLITFSMISNFLISCFTATGSDLSNIIKNWEKNPNEDITISNKKFTDNKVTKNEEAKLICEALEIIKLQLKDTYNKNIESNIYNFTVLFQKVENKEVALYLNDNGIPLLVDILELIDKNNYKVNDYSSCNTMILKMFAFYKNEKGLNKLAELINNEFDKDNYMWSVILNNVIEEETKYNKIINKLDGKIPSGFLGITYLDMCNSIAVSNINFKHPFNNIEGFKFLDSILKNSTVDDDSYIISVTTSVPFLSYEFQSKLLEKILKYDSIDIQIEAAWAGTKIGDEKFKNKLLEFAKDYRYSSKAVSYLKELNLDSLIPVEIKNNDFIALSEMCDWLSHPNEYGTYPDSAFVLDKKYIYWPPTKDKRTLYLIKYFYKNNEDNKIDENVGLVGSITFSLFDIDYNSLSTIEILSIYCNMELQKENYMDIESGVNFLKKYNKDLD